MRPASKTYWCVFDFVQLEKEQNELQKQSEDPDLWNDPESAQKVMKRLARQIPEIKELKPKVAATKKGIIVDTKVTLFSETSIPNITEKIQSIVKNRVQDMLGIEEAIIVRVHINKLVPKEEKKKHKKADTEEVPRYHGIEYSEE